MDKNKVFEFLEISSNFSYELATKFYGFMYDVDLIHVACHNSIFAMMTLSCVCLVIKKLPHGAPRQLLLTDFDKRDPKCGREILGGPFF